MIFKTDQMYFTKKDVLMIGSSDQEYQVTKIYGKDTKFKRFLKYFGINIPSNCYKVKECKKNKV